MDERQDAGQNAARVPRRIVIRAGDADDPPAGSDQTPGRGSDGPEETRVAAGPAAGEGAPPAPQEPVELSYAEYEELKTLAAERDDFLRRLQRAVADYQNLEKRTEKLRQTVRQDALRGLVAAFLPVADGLDMAIEHALQTESAEGMVQGFRLVAKEFYGALEKLGIRPIDAVGQTFDPHYHEAAAQQTVEGAEPFSIVREVAKGFMMGDTVIRPSRVVVAAPDSRPAGGAARGDALG